MSRRPMSRSDRHALLLAVILALLAGYVDALGFLALKGSCGPFWRANAPRFARGGPAGEGGGAATAGSLIALFVLGVVAASLLAPDGPGRQRRMLSLVALLLGLAALAASLGFDRWALGLAATGLGAESDVVRKAGQVNLAVTFMTGTLVRMGHGLADMLRGGARWGWLPYASLWLSLVAGAMAGAAAYPALRLQGLWLPAVCCAVLAAVTRPGPAR